MVGPLLMIMQKDAMETLPIINDDLPVLESNKAIESFQRTWYYHHSFFMGAYRY